MKLNKLLAATLALVIVAGLGTPAFAGPPPPPPPGFVLQETIDPVPITAGAVSSSTTLLNGVEYKIRVSGIFFIGGPGHADAEWAFTPANTGEIDHAGNNPALVDLGVGINDAAVDNDKQPEYGAFATNHIYEVDFTGLGSTIDVNYHDSNYGDNSYIQGESFILEIFAPIPPPDNDQVVGGEIIPIETTALILAGAQSFSWMIPVILSGIGIGLFVVSRKSE